VSGPLPTHPDDQGRRIRRFEQLQAGRQRRLPDKDNAGGFPPGPNGSPNGERRVIAAGRLCAHGQGVEPGPQPVGPLPRLGTRDPAGPPGAVGNAPVERGGQLERHPGPLRMGVAVEKRGVLRGGLGLEGGQPLHRDARTGEQLRAAGGERIGVAHGVDHPPHPRGHEHRSAGRLLALMGTGLEVHGDGRPGHLATSGVERLALRVWPAELRVPSLAHDVSVAQDHRPHQRVGLGPAPPAPRQLHGPAQGPCLIHPRSGRPAHRHAPRRRPRR
jgi:hypothetical protein